MIRVIAGIFLLLHGLVHLLYFGQSARMFELQPGMAWPDGSWAFSKLLGEGSARTLAGIFCILAAAGFALGSAGVFLGLSWWRGAVIASAAFSAILYLLFWNGGSQHLAGQGGVAILINIAILAAVILFRWPRFDF
jgi:hypothetical protein